MQQGVDLGTEGYAVLKVIKVLPREKVEAAATKQELSQYVREWGNAEGRAYYDLLKQQFKVRIMVPAPAGKSL